jgi:hypothetical protein
MANPQFLEQSFNKAAALGERAVQSDFSMVIEGLEFAAPLIRTAQLPEMSRGEPVEDQGAYGMTYHQYGAIKRNGLITATIVELKDGRVEDALWDIINNKKYVKIKLVRNGEDYTEKGFKLKHCIIAVDAGDVDTTATTAAATRNLNITYSWCDKI